MHTLRHRRLELAYVWIYFLVSVVVPLVVLIYAGRSRAKSVKPIERGSRNIVLLDGGSDPPTCSGIVTAHFAHDRIRTNAKMDAIF